MDSDGEDGAQNQFAKQGGDALNLEDDGGFQDSEDVDDPEDEEDAGAAKKSDAKAASGLKEVKGEKLENQPYDLAVSVHDSEEIESEEEDDEVAMADVQRNT